MIYVYPKLGENVLCIPEVNISGKIWPDTGSPPVNTTDKDPENKEIKESKTTRVVLRNKISVPV